MAEGPPSTTTIVTPFSLADFAGAFREVLGVFREVMGITGQALDRLRRWKASQAATNFDSITFPPRGFCRHLQQIAAGRGTDADVDALARRLEATTEEVTARVQGLRKYEDTIRAHCGAAAAHKLREMLDGAEGKFVIRYEIEGLVHMWRGGRSSKDDVKEQAIKILELISRFNDNLINLHDLVFPPRGAPR